MSLLQRPFFPCGDLLLKSLRLLEEKEMKILPQEKWAQTLWRRTGAASWRRSAWN